MIEILRSICKWYLKKKVRELEIELEEVEELIKVSTLTDLKIRRFSLMKEIDEFKWVIGKL